ncbi:ROK family transcriptional regulator [Microbacterium sp. ZXX196]|uniref:ROK family transcriptional regulator n=1 Tax=Microbacterium sp. ZXX196 TaxID=2609291 RepID=UPI0012B75BE3|nr:ROK family transcriptional regulator [Microbacterium sp. ZXX196]MTE22791.1 ROK family protein [Microbacterium sp. ZXX196]
MTSRGSSAGDVRRANLGSVVRLVHRDGALSRAELTARTGLNRSTISDLVGALSEAGLVAEREPDPTRRVGRPSPVVEPGPGVLALAVNPEVDAVEIGAVALGGRVVARIRHPVERRVTPAETARYVGDALAAWRRGPLAGARVRGVAAAVPGLVRAADGLVRVAPHLGWREADLAGELARTTGLPAVATNDASAGAVAEGLFGSARACDDVVYLNGGASGIGGGLILAGSHVGGAGGYAGEWGQNQPSISAGADRRVPGGVLEDEVNRGRLLAAVRMSAADDDALGRALAAATGPDVADEVARQRRILQATLANAANVLNPRVIVLGGFLALLRASDPRAFDRGVRDQMLPAPAENLEIRAAALGADRLLIGAAERVFDALVADPLADPR